MIKNLLIVGMVVLAYNYWPFDPPKSYEEIATAKRELRESEVARRCANPNTIEVTVRSWNGVRVYKCNKRSTS